MSCDISENYDNCKRPLENNDCIVSNKKLCTENNESKLKIPKRRKHALLLGFNGNNYHGMQINKGFKTIESELFEALVKVGVAKEDEIPFGIRFQRAARTDKSVSAVGQVVSFIAAEGYKVEDINAHLSSNVRAFSLKRVTRSFDSKGNCDARTYSYVLPTIVLSKEPLNNGRECDFRISSELVGEINDILNLYVGTHNFHNFTSKKHYEDPSSRRYIMSFKCNEPFVHKKEFLVLSVKGQSFMLHQIRKMVGTVIAIARGIITPEIIETAFLGTKIRIPIAPAEGLFLERAHYDKYNKRFGNDGIHEKLSWDDIEEEIMKFREEKILFKILETEISENNIINWTNSLHEENKYFQSVTHDTGDLDNGAETEESKGESSLAENVSQINEN